MNNQHRVVIVGAGFGGLFAAKALGRVPAQVTVVNGTTYHLFEPLLYQVATGILSEGEVAPPIREILPGRDIRLGWVTDVDVTGRNVVVSSPDGRERLVPYDSLVVAAGASNSYFGQERFAEHAPALKNIDDALEVRSRIFHAFEMAELEEDPGRRQQWLTFVLVGAGPTGVELAGQIAELARDTLRRDYRSIDTGTSRVLLVEGGPRALAAFDQRLSARTARSLGSLGVELRTGALVAGIDAQGVELDTPDGRERVDAGTVIWAAGVRASPLAGDLAAATGGELDRGGRIPVQPDMTLPGHPEVFVIGDMTATGLPGTSPVAMQQGTHAAKMIQRRIAGRETRPFHFRDKGTMATIGRYRAVAEIGPLRLGGVIAWLLWLLIHITYLIGFANRLLVLLRWSISFFTHGRVERVITRDTPP